MLSRSNLTYQTSSRQLKVWSTCTLNSRGKTIHSRLKNAQTRTRQSAQRDSSMGLADDFSVGGLLWWTDPSNSLLRVRSRPRCRPGFVLRCCGGVHTTSLMQIIKSDWHVDSGYRPQNHIHLAKTMIQEQERLTVVFGLCENSAQVNSHML